MERGRRGCGCCEPCGLCGTSVERGALIVAVIYLIIGFAIFATSLAFVILKSEDFSGRWYVVICLFLICSITWLISTIVLFIGIIKRSPCLVNTFLWMQATIPVIILFWGVLYTTIYLGEDKCPKNIELMLMRAMYFTPMILVALTWYPYWVVSAFYIQCGGFCCCIGNAIQVRQPVIV